MSIEKPDLSSIEDTKDPDFVKNRISRFEFSGKGAIIFGIIGLGIAMIYKKNRIGWTVAGIIGGGIVGNLIEKAVAD